MKICFVTESLDEKHGYGRVSVNLIRALAQQGIEGPILTFEKTLIPKDLRKRALPCLRHHPLTPLSYPLDLWKDHRMITNAAKDCDGIHFLTESFLATTIFGYRKPYIVTAYGTWAINPLKSNQISRMVFSNAYKGASQVAAISNETKKRLINEINSMNISTIYLGIDAKKWRSNKEKKADTLNILTVAAINPSKGLDISLKGVIQYSKTKSVQYTVIGGKSSKPYQQQLEKYAKEHDFNNLTIINRANDVDLISHYQEADIFILPSVEIKGDYEGFGLILLEAFAAKVPVIATDSGAISEIVIDGVNGLLIPERNHDAIEKAIYTLSTDSKLREKLIENGLKSLEKFSLSKMVNGYRVIYKKFFL